MKSLYEYYDDYIRKYRSHKCLSDGRIFDSHFYKIEGYVNQAYEYFGDNVPENLIDIIHDDIDYILENLNTHDYKLLIKKLQQNFKDYISEADIIYDKGETDKNSFYLKILDKSILDNEEFLKLFEFFNYRIREIRNDYIIVEPIYSKRIDTTSPVLYHFTTTNKLDSILRNGLRPKRSKYANTLERVYLYNPLHNLNLVNDSNAIKFIQSLFGGVIPRNLVVLKIDLYGMTFNNTPLNLYQDTAMDFNEACFTQHLIPAEYIKEVKIKGINK